jgi:hypothetical protein
MPSHAQKDRNVSARSHATQPEPADAASLRVGDLAGPFADREFRTSYMAHHLRAFLADQIRGLRGNTSQKEFGTLIGKPQSVVSRLEDEDYGKVSLQTLIDIAARLDIGLVVRFVDFPAFIAATSDFTGNTVVPAAYNSRAMDPLIGS